MFVQHKTKISKYQNIYISKYQNIKKQIRLTQNTPSELSECFHRWIRSQSFITSTTNMGHQQQTRTHQWGTAFQRGTPCCPRSLRGRNPPAMLQTNAHLEQMTQMTQMEQINQIKKMKQMKQMKDRNGRCQFNSNNNNRSTNTIFSCSNKKRC
jgi:hypothetical protein